MYIAEDNERPARSPGTTANPGSQYPGVTAAVTQPVQARMANNGEPVDNEPPATRPGQPPQTTRRPAEPTEPPPGSAGGAGTSTGGGTTGTPPPPAPRPAAGPRVDLNPQMQWGNDSNLGVPTQGAGSFRNIQNFLSTNAAAESDFARRQYAQPLQQQVSSTLATPNAIPTWAQYSASQYPVAATVASGTQPTGSASPSGSGGARPAPPRTTAPAPAPTTTQRSGSAPRPPPPTGGGTPAPATAGTGAMGDMNLTAQANDQAYRLGIGASPQAYQSYLQSRGQGAGTSKLDAYLYGATPGGAQQDVRNMQQTYGGLLNLVGTQTPYGSKLDSQGQVVAPEAPPAASGTNPGRTRPPANPPQEFGEGDTDPVGHPGKTFDGTKWIPTGTYNKLNRGDMPVRGPGGRTYEP